MRRVAVGSMNPVKVAAVQAVVERIWANCQVVAVSAESGVPAQPFGDDETQRGALTRARGALSADPQADVGIGIEGGVVLLGSGAMRTCAWAVAIDREGIEGVGGSLAMPLPRAVAARIAAGEELGHAMDHEAQTIGTKWGRGAVGILTAGLIDRQRAYEPLVTFALAPWLAPEFFGDQPSDSGR